ncbi:MAG: endonuclease [Candidatus Omnitrophica bacterium]|nr:endonuclease [Candidatus Omnitrophota bacterium]
MDIYLLYKNLKKKYGKPKGQWALWCKRPKTKEEIEQVIIESVLTQRANWKNVCYAVSNLKNNGLLSLEKIVSIKEDELKELIRPSGFYKVKAKRLKELCNFVVNECGGVESAKKISLEIIRKNLLSLNGIGEETADDILLYAFEKPVFVIDEYTRRLVKRYNLTDKLSYKHLQEFFEKSLGKKDYALYQDFHALIVIDGKEENR